MYITDNYFITIRTAICTDIFNTLWTDTITFILIYMTKIINIIYIIFDILGIVNIFIIVLLYDLIFMFSVDIGI